MSLEIANFVENSSLSPLRIFNNLPMNKGLYIIFIINIFVLFPKDTYAQTPVDALMMNKGQLCLAAIYGHESWDEYWEGTLKRDNGNIGTLTRQSVTPMFALGLSDRVNIIGALPWVSTEASQGQMRGVSGLQDLGLWIKARAYVKETGNGVFTIHTTLGVMFPVSNYLADYVPFSLGLGCPDFSMRAILEQRLDKGLYVRGNAAYLVRGNATIERDYYYTTHGVYSEEVDMPNAMSYAITLGSWFFDNALSVEATYDGLNSFGGFDIRRQEPGFPSNKMVFTRIGARVHYYLPFVPGLGIIAEGTQVLSGRNFGQSTGFSTGITYQFGVWGKKKSTDEAN